MASGPEILRRLAGAEAKAAEVAAKAETSAARATKATPRPVRVPKDLDAFKHVQDAAKALEGKGIKLRDFKIKNGYQISDGKPTKGGWAGNTKVVQDASGRMYVQVEINGHPVTFYKSSGKGGKVHTVEGGWYPVLGVSDTGHIGKLRDADLAKYYGSDELKRVAGALDEAIGNIQVRGGNKIPTLGPNELASKEFQSQINAGMKNENKIEVGMTSHEDDVKSQGPANFGALEDNLNDLKQRISGNKPSGQQATASLNSGGRNRLEWKPNPDGSIVSSDGTHRIVNQGGQWHIFKKRGNAWERQAGVNTLEQAQEFAQSKLDDLVREEETARILRERYEAGGNVPTQKPTPAPVEPAPAPNSGAATPSDVINNVERPAVAGGAPEAPTGPTRPQTAVDPTDVVNNAERPTPAGPQLPATVPSQTPPQLPATTGGQQLPATRPQLPATTNGRPTANGGWEIVPNTDVGFPRPPRPPRQGPIVNGEFGDDPMRYPWWSRFEKAAPYVGPLGVVGGTAISLLSDYLSNRTNGGGPTQNGPLQGGAQGGMGGGQQGGVVAPTPVGKTGLTVSDTPPQQGGGQPQQTPNAAPQNSTIQYSNIDSSGRWMADPRDYEGLSPIAASQQQYLNARGMATAAQNDRFINAGLRQPDRSKNEYVPPQFNALNQALWRHNNNGSNTGYVPYAPDQTKPMWKDGAWAQPTPPPSATPAPSTKANTVVSGVVANANGPTPAPAKTYGTPTQRDIDLFSKDPSEANQRFFQETYGPNSHMPFMPKTK